MPQLRDLAKAVGVESGVLLAAIAVQMSGAEPHRKRLAVHARQLAIEPRLHQLRQYRRPLLRSLEQTHRPARSHQINRDEAVGAYRSIIKAVAITAVGLRVRQAQSLRLGLF